GHRCPGGAERGRGLLRHRPGPRPAAASRAAPDAVRVRRRTLAGTDTVAPAPERAAGVPEDGGVALGAGRDGGGVRRRRAGRALPAQGPDRAGRAAPADGRPAAAVAAAGLLGASAGRGPPAGRAADPGHEADPELPRQTAQRFRLLRGPLVPDRRPVRRRGGDAALVPLRPAVGPGGELRAVGAVFPRRPDLPRPPAA